MKKATMTALFLMLSGTMGTQALAFADITDVPRVGPTYPPTPIPTPDPDDDDDYSGRRMDCRFYGHEKKRHSCRSSATYDVNDRTKDIKRVHYGVACDRQTIYDGKGTIEPEETIADHIRPMYAATPMVSLNESYDLRNEGSYSARLELDNGKSMHGHCYVTKTDKDDDDDKDKNKKKGQITGYKFKDRNDNGRDDSEPRLSGFTITLTNLGPITISRQVVTGADGSFSFGSLPLQAYLVCETAPTATPPWVPTTPSCVNVDLTYKKRSAQVVFGDIQKDLGDGCVRTQGFWGNSPQGQALLQQLVADAGGSIPLGNNNYNATQLDQILDANVATPGPGANALMNLAHQLIAAKLNILNGASDVPVAATITQADTLIGNLLIPPVGSADVDPNSTLGQQMTALAATLDRYNNGLLGVPHCTD